ncbi:hypothetical protein NDU88_003757 [Pleurodeles waltl]|uniref:Uncharacterized protein n=1 Tax=Pleurodeles waltl TaxID=8319 RepID=A0AAV7LGD8_PLEWA|nr:hypothetical protein NDU88_003757 [Pleurodeles waltl]
MVAWVKILDELQRKGQPQGILLKNRFQNSFLRPESSEGAEGSTEELGNCLPQAQWGQSCYKPNTETPLGETAVE